MILRMTWEHLLFAHWKMNASLLQAVLPEGMTLDTYEGDGYIAVVPFMMSNIQMMNIPLFPMLSFPELNLRTYVDVNGKKGVYFFSLDANSYLAVLGANRFFHLHYKLADLQYNIGAEGVTFKGKRAGRTTFDGVYGGKGNPYRADKGSFAHWATERYCFFTSSGQHIYCGDIQHEPWTLQDGFSAEIPDTLFAFSNLKKPSEEPHLLYGRKIEVVTSSIKRIT